jgi:hypothetical protein
MKKLIYICIIALTISCSDDKKQKLCIMVQSSDANPIQLFYNGEQTFNETEYDSPSIEKFCFFQDFQCDDEIRLQIFNDESDDDYDLVVYDEDNEEIDRIEFVKDTFSTEVSNLPELGEFENSGAGIDWIEGAEPEVLFTGIESSKNLSEAFDIDSGLFTLTYEIEGPVNTTASMRFYKSGSLVASVSLKNSFQSGVISDTKSLSLSDSIDEIVFFASASTGSGGDVKIVSYSISAVRYVHEVEFTATERGFCNQRVRFEAVNRDTEEIILHTDYVNFETVVKNSVLIKYKSEQNFAGLIYNEYSQYRWLRVAGRFFHPAKAGTQASSELSNGTVITRNYTMKRRKKLEVQDCPEYMNVKIDLALAHCVDDGSNTGIVEINGVMWILDGEQYQYEGAADRPDTYPLQPGEVLLTRKNYFKQNVI